VARLIVVLDGMMAPHVHRMMQPVRAMENRLFVASCNRVGQGAVGKVRPPIRLVTIW